MRAYLRALETALHGAGLPYGSAITVSSTGAVLMGAQGPPSSAASSSSPPVPPARTRTAVLDRDHGGEAGTQLTRSPHLLRAAAIHVAAITLAIGAAVLIARIDGVLAQPSATFAATILYLGVPSVDKALIDRERWPSRLRLDTRVT